MTKTPEELTAEWKAGKLEDGAYYIQFNDGCVKVATLETWYEEPGKRPEKDFSPYFDSEITSVLAPHPTYAEYTAMQDQIADLSKKVEELEDEIAELEKENKQLEKDIDYGWYTAGIESDKNDKLLALLKECKNIVAHDCWQEAQFPDGQVVERQDLLDRINAAIGESEEK